MSASDEPRYLRLQVKDFRDETPWIRTIALGDPSDVPLPPAEPGAHLRIRLPGDYDERHYSLVDLPDRRDASRYLLGVRLDLKSKGGSRYMHALTRGDKVWAYGPNNAFPLVEGEAPVILFAGGIGITPLTAMASRLVDQQRPFTLHYAGRTRRHLAFVEPLTQLCGERLKLYVSDEPGGRLDVAAAMAGTASASHVYVCGPARMIEAVREAAETEGLAENQVHAELFEAAPSAIPNTAFDVVLARTGREIHVPADRSILEMVRGEGLDPPADCTRGGCGMCQVRVIEGEPDHRDAHLSKRERERGEVMQICVSRSFTPRLVIDL